MATMFYEPFKVDESGDMPPPDAVEKILPEYQYIFYSSKTKQANKLSQSSKAQTHSPAEQEVLPFQEPNDQSANTEMNLMTMVDVQMRELESYRQAVQKMGREIINLQKQVHDAEEENSKLGLQLTRHDEIRKELLITTSDELDKIDKNELVIRYMTIKHRLQTQTTELSEIREKYQKVQTEIIKQLDKVKELTEMEKAHILQSKALQHMQEKYKKVTKLEQACLHQERVIENMEKVLNSKKFSVEGASKALSEENQRLRKELEQLRANGTTEDEKLKLYEQLEKAEYRVVSLERILSDNSRAWAKEKQELELRLKEAEYGLTLPQNEHYNFKPMYSPRRTDKAEYGYRSPPLPPIKRWY